MAFWGCVLKPGQKKPVNVGSSDVLHLSQACLHNPQGGKNFLQVQVKGTTYSIACLEKDKREHDCLDLFFDSEETTFVSKGNSEIHLMGYIEPSDFHEESEEEDQHVAAKAGSPKQSPKKSPQAAPQQDSEDSMDFPEGEESEEEGQMASDDMDEFPEDEESEEESQSLPPQKAAGLKQAPAGSPKRKAEDAPGSPAKKANTNDELSGYVQKLVAFLKANGKQNIGQLGSKVPRPAGCPKMKAVFDQFKDKFALVGDSVSAK